MLQRRLREHGRSADRDRCIVREGLRCGLEGPVILDRDIDADVLEPLIRPDRKACREVRVRLPTGRA